MSLRIDRASDDEARELLRATCGSTRWVEAMLARRPFHDQAGLLAVAREIWFSLDEADWREAFARHPRIGDRAALSARFPESHAFSRREQSRVAGAPPDLLTTLAQRNEEYFQRFGYIFIVCATGLTAAEMLAMLETRLPNDPAREIRVAAAEQARITELRLKASA